MQVVVLEDDGTIVRTGESTGKRIDGMYMKVDSELYNVHAVYPAENADEAASALRQLAALTKEHRDAEHNARIRILETYSMVPLSRKTT